MAEAADETQKGPKSSRADVVEAVVTSLPRYLVGQTVFFIADNSVQSDVITGCMLMNYQYYYTTKTLTKFGDLSGENWTPQEKVFGTKEELISSL